MTYPLHLGDVAEDTRIMFEGEAEVECDVCRGTGHYVFDHKHPIGGACPNCDGGFVKEHMDVPVGDGSPAREGK